MISRLEVKETNFITPSGQSFVSQKGVFTKEDIKRGETVLNLADGKIVTKRTQTSIQIGDGIHSEHRIGGYINHAPLPHCNTLVIGLEILAIRDISEGEELTFDYTSNEDKVKYPFYGLYSDQPTLVPNNQTVTTVPTFEMEPTTTFKPDII